MKKQLFALLFCLPILAALPPLDEDQLWEQADQVVTAQVLSIQKGHRVPSIHGHETWYQARVKVRRVLQGVKIRKGQTIVVQYRRIHFDGPGPIGQMDLPEVGDLMQAFLKRPIMDTYDLLEPNGWRPLGIASIAKH